MAPSRESRAAPMTRATDAGVRPCMAWGWLWLSLLGPFPGFAAEPNRPSATPLPEPAFEAPAPAAPRLLPPIPPRRDAREGAVAADVPALVVRRWIFEGHTVYSDAELAAVLEPWTGRAIEPADLQAARDALTLHYVQGGYFTSGARIPDQDVADGSVRVQLFEGSLVDIELAGNERLRDVYLRSRLERAAGRPLHVPSLEERIRLLQGDERIARIDASLRPGDRPGEARLEVSVDESDPLHASLHANNFMAPSLGDVRGLLELRHANFAGLGDELTVFVGGYQAGPELEARYRLPLTRYDTSLGLSARWTDAEIVRGLGQELDVEGEFWSFEIDLRQPLYRTPSVELALGLTSALRQADTQILGEEFNEVGSRTRVLVFRLYQELLWRGRNQVVSTRSTVNFGAHGLGSTRARETDLPDSEFVSWLGQLQWLQRFEPWNIETLVRGEVQLTDDPLLSPEQYAAGGHATVRGYRENQIVRDQGFSASFELRLPIWQDAVDGRTIVQLSPFFDVGGGWERNASRGTPRTLYSTGLSLRVAPTTWLRGELIWGRRLEKVERPDGLQGNGIQFQVVLDLY